MFLDEHGYHQFPTFPATDLFHSVGRFDLNRRNLDRQPGRECPGAARDGCTGWRMGCRDWIPGSSYWGRKSDFLFFILSISTMGS